MRAVTGPRMMTPDLHVFVYGAYEGMILNPYDEYLSSCVSHLGNFKSEWGDLRLNLSSQRGPLGVCTGPGASDVPELVVLFPYK